MVASFGRCGMMGKTWRILLSSSIALNNQTTLQLLKANNSTGHLSIIRNVSTDPLSLDLVFIIASVLRSFPTYTAPGPSIKISSFFQPLQFEVACRSGAEKIVHRLSRNSIEEHWMEDDSHLRWWVGTVVISLTSPTLKWARQRSSTTTL